MALQTQDGIDWTVLDAAYSAQVVYEPLVVPSMVRIDPEDRIFANSNSGACPGRIMSSAQRPATQTE